MNTMTSNLTLAFGILLLMLSVLLLPWIKAEPWPVRVLWVSGVGSALGLAVYYTLWIPKSSLGLTATTTAAEREPGALLAGIPWSPNYTEVHVAAANSSRKNYEAVDLVIQPDQPIACVGQETNINNVSILVPYDLRASLEIADGDMRKRTAMSIVPVASGLGYRVRCDVLPSHSRLDIVLAVVTVNDKPADQEVDKLLRIDLSDDKKRVLGSIWYAHHDHSQRIFGRKPTVKNVIITGTFIASGRENSVSSSLAVEDLAAKVFTKLHILTVPAPPQPGS
jgi:hypothetical protein